MAERLVPGVADSREPVEHLAAEFVERYRNGENPGFDEYAGRYPELADEIRELFPTIAQLEKLRQAKEQTSDDRAVFGVPRFTQLGGFRIIRELGRGGMGVVYEAEDKSLKRRVALKVLGANIAGSPKQLERFRHEAEAAARLHHTHIVPVFGTGQEDGILFYAMQFIDGVPLSDVIDQLRQETEPSVAVDAPRRERSGGDLWAANARLWRDTSTIAQFIAKLADALAYAHGQRVLHRDIKPGNVLVDRDGNIWISDFGLAKHVDQTGLTGTGEVVGTLRYKAPEQLDGYADPRSDIYSLGLVLFELLTLTPACSESQYGPLICEKTIRSIPSPRSINAAVPRDLETITLKACALEAAHRYQTAGELADDLRRFLEDRPIRARRTSPAERLWRWSRRNRLVAALSSVAVVLLAAVAVVFAVGNHNTNVALKDAVTAAVSAEHERQLAERNLNLAVRALDEIMQNISERGIPQTLHVAIGGEEDSLQHLTVTGADAALLKSLLHFFDEFASENRAYLNVQTATALKRIGAIQQRLGKPKEAEAAFQQSVSIYRQLASANPEDLRLTIEMATAWNLIGKVRSQAGEDRGVIEAHKAALDVLESSAVTQASNAGQFELAETLILLGTIGSRTGGAELRARLRELHDLDSSGAEPRQVHQDEPRPGIETDSYSGIWRPYPARLFQRAATILQSLLERDPENPAYQFALAKVRGRIRMMPRGASDAETTEIQYAADESIRILRQLVGRFPDSPLYTYELARTLGRVGQRCVHLELALREERLQESLHLANQLVMAHPQVPEYQTLGAAAERRLGDFAQQRGDAAGAAECYRHALLVHEKLAARFRSVSLYQIGYAQTLAEWAEIQRLTGEPDAARETLDKAISVIERSAELLTQDSVFQDFLDYLHRKRQDPTAQHHSPKNPFLGPSAIGYPFPSSSPSQPPRRGLGTTK